MFAQHDGEDHDWHQENRGPRRNGRPILTAGPDDGGYERRCRLGCARCQQNRERIFIPGKNQTKYGRRCDASRRLWQHHFIKRLKAGVAVDQSRFFVFYWDLVDEAFE